MTQERGFRLRTGELECAEWLQSDFEGIDVHNPFHLDGWTMLIDGIRDDWIEAEGRTDCDPVTPAMHAALEFLRDHEVVLLSQAEMLEEAFHFAGVYWIEEQMRNCNFGYEDRPESYSNWCLKASEAGYEVSRAIAKLRRLVADYDMAAVALNADPVVELTFASPTG